MLLILVVTLQSCTQLQVTSGVLTTSITVEKCSNGLQMHVHDSKYINLPIVSCALQMKNMTSIEPLRLKASKRKEGFTLMYKICQIRFCEEAHTGFDVEH